MFFINRLQKLCIGVLVLCLPTAGYLALHAKVANRNTVATMASIVFATALNLLFLSPLTSSPSEAGKDGRRRKYSRIRNSALIFLSTSFIIHLTWELGWLVLVKGGRQLRGGGENGGGDGEINLLPSLADSLLGYPWYIYIDTGDTRYLTVPNDLFVIECLSVLNGICGMIFLATLFRRSRNPSNRSRHDSTTSGNPKHETVAPLLGLTCCAAVHLYSCSYYFLSELTTGCEHCDLSGSLLGICNVFFAFFLANVPWMYMPIVVFYWVAEEICMLLRSHQD